MDRNWTEKTLGQNAQLKWLELVRQHVESLHYGVVQIVVHDSQVLQIDKTERVRFEKARAES